MGWRQSSGPILASKVVVCGDGRRIYAHKTRPFVVDVRELQLFFPVPKVVVCGACY